MELWLTFVALYAWQCAVRLPEGSSVFGPLWCRADARPRRGLHWLSFWPSRLAVTPMRLPFHVAPGEDALLAHFDLSRGASSAGSTQRRIDLDDEPVELDLQGSLLFAQNRPFVRSASKSRLRIWCWIVRALSQAPPATRTTQWMDFFAHSLDPEVLERCLETARHRTRWLGWLCDLIVVLAFAGVPVLGLLLGAERALTLAWPSMLALHALGLGLAFHASRPVSPGTDGERLGELLMAALYPPALLRFPATLIDAATAGFHPLAWSCVLGSEKEAFSAWRREVAWLEAQARRSPEQADWLEAASHAIEKARPSAFLNRRDAPSPDPNAESYCPVCLDDFRSGFDRCTACNTPTIRYPKPA